MIDCIETSARERLILGGALAAYAAVVATGVAVHEPWWDEAQAWLLARDASIADLLTRRLAYEGHPPLWYLILAIPAKLGLPYKSINVVAALIGTAGVVWLAALRHVPIAVRAVLPFTFFSAYQFTVVSRAYVLIPPLLFAIAAIYERRDQCFVRFALLLALLMQVSVHGACLAAGLLALFAVDVWRGRQQRPPLAAATAILAASAAVLLFVLWPRPGLLSPVDLSCDPRKIARLAAGIATASLGVPGALAIPLVTILLLWAYRRGVLLELAVLTAVMLPVASMYFARWHEGLFFWAAAFALLLPARSASPRLLSAAGWTIVAAVFALHVLWTAQSLAYDVRAPFTGSRAAARFIADHGLVRKRLATAGLRCTELQPYFPRRDAPAFWDWTQPAVWNVPADADVVVTCSGYRADHLYGAAMRRRADYRELASFRGGYFWKDRIAEETEFAIFERVAP